MYLSEEAALPVLEVLVQLDLSLELIPDDYVLLRIELMHSARACMERGPGIREDDECRAFGDRWLDEARALLLRVPSVLVEESHNLLLNPAHPLADRLPAPVRRPFVFDLRLLM